jgi:DNA-binding CsgD family transcriptional regulator
MRFFRASDPERFRAAGWCAVIRRETTKTVLVYGLTLALSAVLLRALEYRFLARTHSLELYISLLAAGFMAFGIWVGAKLFRHPVPRADFDGNLKAQRSLGISDRELEVLRLMTEGRSNKEIATRLHVSPNTVKTHVARLYEKLDVGRRTEAIHKARELGMIP